MTEPPTVVVAGGPVAGRSALVQALLAGQGLSPTDRAAAADAMVVYRHGRDRRAVAHIPGFREPRPVALRPAAGPAERSPGSSGRNQEASDGDGTTYYGQALLSTCARPPRRLESWVPAALLRHVTLVDTPATEPFDDVYATICGRVAAGAVVVYVVDARRPIRAAELDFLSELARRDARVVFALHRSMGSAPVLRHRLAGRLARAPWFGTDSAGGLAALRSTVIELARDGRRPAPGPARRVPTQSGPLEAGISRSRLAVVRRLANELATAQETCQQRIGGPAGPRRLPEELDRQLQALSIRVSDDLDGRCRALAERLPRVDSGPGLPEQVLLLTSDTTVTALCGTGSLAGLCADPDPAGSPLVRPIEVALTAGAYLTWRRRGEVGFGEATSWLRRALDAVAAELLVAVETRCAEVHRVLSHASIEPKERDLALAD